MQHKPEYENVVDEVYKYLVKRIESAKRCGVNKVIADVGIGFGKNDQHNLELLKNHSMFKGLGTQLLLGISRKSFIGRLLGIEKPEERDTATAMLHSLLLKSGADIIRVHNVKYLNQLRKLSGMLYG
jgi:dihydropteroate synthase